MDTANTTIVMAEPGWRVFTLARNGTGDGHELSYCPVLAWRVMQDDETCWAVPVTYSGVTWGGNYCVKQPDGRFVFEDEPFSASDAEILLALIGRQEDRARAIRQKGVLHG